MTRDDHILDWLNQLATDIRRLKLRTEPGSMLEHIADRLASHVETIYLILTPTAGELAKWTAPGDDAAVDEAIAIKDADLARLQARLGKTTA